MFKHSRRFRSDKGFPEKGWMVRNFSICKASKMNGWMFRNWSTCKANTMLLIDLKRKQVDQFLFSFKVRVWLFKHSRCLYSDKGFSEKGWMVETYKIAKKCGKNLSKASTCSPVTALWEKYVHVPQKICARSFLHASTFFAESVNIYICTYIYIINYTLHM